jgi:hypothetical protein
VQVVDTDLDIMTATFATPLSVGTHEVVFEFDGILNDTMAGFYRSAYKGAAGETKYMAATQV